jgi:hypothetical protein
MDERPRRIDSDAPGSVRVYGWSWGTDVERRPGLPWLGIFLLVFGLLLLVERLLPGFEFAGSAFVVAIGMAFLVRWAVDRRSVGSLYIGAIVTALGMPGLLEGLDIVAGPGLGQLCLGVAFLGIAAVRAAGGGGVGWQAWLGVILAVLGASQLAAPQVGSLVIPALILVLGALLLAREFAERRAGSRSR